MSGDRRVLEFAVMILKKELRRQLLQGRLALSEKERREKSAEISRLVVDLVAERAASAVMVYFSSNAEVDLGSAIGEFFRGGKKVLAPKVSGSQILPIQLASPTDTKVGFKGILEPKGDSPFTEPIDVIFVPGLAFDEEHFRLGYGGGYYDRFLAAHPEAFAVGCFYASQFSSELPVEEHDQPLHVVVTEEGLQ